MKSLKMTLMLQLLVLVVGFTNAQEYKVRFAFLGNSITEGYGLSNPSKDSYPAQLATMLEEIYGDTVVVGNFGVSGRTMLKKGDHPLWNEKKFQEAYEFAPDICYILLGTNDTKPYNWDAYGNEFYDDYLAMMDTFKLRNPRVKYIVCYPPPAWEVVFDIRDSVIVHEVIPIVDSILKVRDAELVDFYNPLLDSVYLFPDKIHPNIDGATVMAKMIKDKVIETDIIHQVETGYTFVTSLVSNTKIAKANDSVTLSWTSINADSVFLNGQLVDLSGSKKVASAQTTPYTLKAIGKKNVDSLIFLQEYYTPEITKISISPRTYTMNQGDTVLLTSKFKDQYSKTYSIGPEIITWTIEKGEGELINETTESAMYVAGSTGTVVIKVAYEDISASNKITVEPANSILDNEKEVLNVYPNPFSNEINITLGKKNHKELRVKLFTIDGSMIYDKKHVATNSMFTVNTEKIKAGNIIMEIWSENKIFSTSLIKL